MQKTFHLLQCLQVSLKASRHENLILSFTNATSHKFIDDTVRMQSSRLGLNITPGAVQGSMKTFQLNYTG
jgi:hypothetical protein